MSNSNSSSVANSPPPTKPTPPAESPTAASPTGSSDAPPSNASPSSDDGSSKHAQPMDTNDSKEKGDAKDDSDSSSDSAMDADEGAGGGGTALKNNDLFNASGSSSDSEGEKEKKLTKDLFGGDMSSSDDSDADQKPSKPSRMSSDSDDSESRIKRLTVKSDDGGEASNKSAEEDEPEEVPEPDPIYVEVPRVNVKLGGDPYYVKLPNFLTIQTHPFDEQYYEQETEEGENVDEEGRMRLKLRCENTIRWRKALDEDGNEVGRESNAKFVRWSDGSMSLQLGGEMFDVIELPIHENRHLFLRQTAGLEGHDLFTKKMIFRPHSTDTLTHRKMTLNMAERSLKAKKTKLHSLEANRDPELEKLDTIRHEEQSLRATLRREGQQRRIREFNNYGPGSSMSAGYLEPGSGVDSDDNVGAIKRAYRDHERDAFEGRGRTHEDDARRLQRAKRIESDEDSDEEEETLGQTNKKKVIEDDDDSD